MNTLIADSGASKTDWVLLGEGQSQFIQTEGLNPHLVPESEFLHILNTELKPNLLGKAVNQIHFFGSGCGSSQKKTEVERYLKEVYEFAEVKIGTDLDAAGMALFGKEEGIACILGTGSSAGVFRNGEVINQMPSIGYPDGDEGGGSDIGKHILTLYQTDQLHSDLKTFLDSKIEIDTDVLRQMLNKPKEGKLLASRVCKIMGEKSQHDQMHEIIHKRFDAFLKKVCSAFSNETKSRELGFVGSVASVYELELRACAKQLGLDIKSIVRSPIEQMALHFNP